MIHNRFPEMGAILALASEHPKVAKIYDSLGLPNHVNHVWPDASQTDYWEVFWYFAGAGSWWFICPFDGCKPEGFCYNKTYGDMEKGIPYSEWIMAFRDATAFEKHKDPLDLAHSDTDYLVRWAEKRGHYLGIGT